MILASVAAATLAHRVYSIFEVNISARPLPLNHPATTASVIHSTSRHARRFSKDTATVQPTMLGDKLLQFRDETYIVIDAMALL